MKLMMIDGNSMINRAYFGVRELTAPDGAPTNAVYGFLVTLRKLVEEEKPNGVCVAFDLKAPTFRHIRYEAYKAHRKSMPDDLAVQIPVIKEVLDIMGIKRCELEGYEADDLIGTVSLKCEEAGWDCLIVTGDKDSFCLISERTHVKHIRTKAGKTEALIYDPEKFREEYGFEPERMPDLKALMGDASDNIPGVSGVGEKTAADLIRKYGTVEKLYSRLDSPEITENLRQKLEKGKDAAALSLELATIQRNAPLEFDPRETLCEPFAGSGLYDIFKRLGFNKLIFKWKLDPKKEALPAPDGAARLEEKEAISRDELDEIIKRAKNAACVSVIFSEGQSRVSVCDGTAVYNASLACAGAGYNDFLKKLLSADIKKVSVNVKDQAGLLISSGLPDEGFVFDVGLAAYLADSSAGDFDAGRIARAYLGSSATGSAAEDILRLHPVLEAELKNIGASRLYHDIEMPLCRVLAEMEAAGFAADKRALEDFGEKLGEGILKLTHDIWETTGEEFNIASPKQLGEVLFDKLALPSAGKTKTGRSTSADVLEKLIDKHPVIRLISDYRLLTKLKSAYSDGLLRAISSDGRIHTNYRMTVTATGRLSSTDPNLQNIPVRSEIGGEIRKMLTAEPGCVLADADYSQIELRLLAHISGDKTMIKAFRSGEDIHAVTASQVFGVRPEEVTPVMRRHAKAVNFGIVYGISAFSLSRETGVGTYEAKAYIDAYLEKYDGVRDYMKKIVETAKADGYVSTLFGRRRYLPELRSSDFNRRSFGERVALNMPIQGTAADIIKLAMVNVRGRLKEEGLRARLILQVHDELIVECPEEEIERVKEILKREMEEAVSLDVPLTADVHTGKSWYDAK
ncbi:MAG: DNA polymerase I [Oscillospiraceae bacterium]|nr:DNA polymerase I [Oscillospiraceae bacterium]